MDKTLLICTLVELISIRMTSGFLFGCKGKKIIYLAIVLVLLIKYINFNKHFVGMNFYFVFFYIYMSCLLHYIKFEISILNKTKYLIAKLFDQ